MLVLGGNFGLRSSRRPQEDVAELVETSVLVGWGYIFFWQVVYRLLVDSRLLREVVSVLLRWHVLVLAEGFDRQGQSRRLVAICPELHFSPPEHVRLVMVSMFLRQVRL